MKRIWMGESWAPQWKPIEESPQFKYYMIGYYVDHWKLEEYDHVEDCAYYPKRKCVKGSGEGHKILMRFLQQIRESRGYDMDCCPPQMARSIFLPKFNLAKSMENQEYRDELMKSVNFAVQEINALAQKFGKRYKLKEVEKVVYTTNFMDLLTFTVTDDVDGDGGDVKTVQAMVYRPPGDGAVFVLEEWRFKPNDSA